MVRATARRAGKWPQAPFSSKFNHLRLFEPQRDKCMFFKTMLPLINNAGAGSSAAHFRTAPVQPPALETVFPILRSKCLAAPIGPAGGTAAAPFVEGTE